MKKVLAVLVLLGAGFAHAQVIGLNPTPQAEYYWNTTTNQWTACTNSSTAEPFQSLPQAFVQEGFNTSLGRWTPVTQCTTSGGGASITVNMGSPLTSPVNFQNSGGAGEINFTNPTDSNVQATLANAYTLINGVNCPLGPAGCALPPYCAGPTCANLDQNNPGFTTGVLTTTAAITSTSLVIPVASTAGFPSTGCGWTAPVVEAICWDSITPTSLVLNTLTNRRGTNGYGANSHVLGSTIEGNVFSLALSATTAQLQAISTGNQLAFNNAINPGLAQNNVFGGNTLFEAQAQVSGKLTVGGGLVITGNSPILNSLSNTAGTQLVNCAPHGTPSGLFCNDEGNWVAAGGGLTGLTTGLYPVATSATTVGNGHIDEITNVGQVTSTLPLYVNPTDGNDQTSLVVSGELTGQTSTIFDVDNFSGSIYLSVQGDGSNDEPGWVTITNGIELGGGSFLGGEGPNNSICGSFDTLPSEGTINCITYSGSGMAITSGSVGSFVPIITFGTSISSAVPSPQLTLTPTGLELNYLTPSTSPLCYPTGSPAVVTNVGCTGGGLSGLTNGVVPIATSGTTVGNSTIDTTTNVGYYTFGSPVQVPSGSLMNGSAICTTATGCGSAALTLTTTGTSGAATFLSGVLNVPVYVSPSGAYLALNPAANAQQKVTTQPGDSTTFEQISTGNVGTVLSNVIDMQSYGQGYNLGNNGTSAQGWSTQNALTLNSYTATRGIMQGLKLNCDKNAEGDFSCIYGYPECYGGYVDTSGEGCQGMTLQMTQTPWYNGTLVTPSVGTVSGPHSSSTSGITYVWIGGNGGPVTFQTSGTMQTFSVVFTGNTTAQTVDIGLATPNGTNSFILGTPIGVSLSALTCSTGSPCTVTWTPSDFGTVTPAAGQTIYFYAATGNSPANGSIAGTGFSGVPSAGTFSTSSQAGLLMTASLAAPTNGANSVTLAALNCNINCTNPHPHDNLPDGGILINTSETTSSVTLGAESIIQNGMSYVLTAGTVPVSTAWGTLIPGSCTGNGNGQYQAYTATTCTVTLGTSPASPGHFAVSGGITSCPVVATSPGTSLDIHLSGPFAEEAYIIAVTTGSTTDSITFCTRNAWNNGNAARVMQGGPVSEAFVSNAAIGVGWPVAYIIDGAFSSTQLAFSNCVGGGVGACNGNGSTGNILASGTAVTIYSAALITGSGNGATNTATLATNIMPLTLADNLVGAPAAEISMEGIRLVCGQWTPNDYSVPSSCLQMNDAGGTPLPYMMRFGNGASSGNPSLALIHTDAGYWEDTMYLTDGPTRSLMYLLHSQTTTSIFQTNDSFGNLSFTHTGSPFYDETLNWSETFNALAYEVGGSLGIAGQVLTSAGPTGLTMWAAIPWATPGTIGSTTPNSGAFTTLSSSSTTTLAAATTIGGNAVCLVTGTNCPADGISGGTTGYVAIFGTSSTITSGIALGTTGSDIPQLSSGLLASSIVPWGSPGTIGSITPNSGAFTTLTATSLALGSSPPTCGAGVSGCGAFAEAGTAVTPAAGVDTIRADSSHLFMVDLNGGSEFTSLMNFSTVNLASSAAGGVTGLLPNANIANPYTAISNPITSATGGSGTGTITCLTAACTNLRGTYSVAGGTFTTGTFLTLVWPTTTAAYACTITQNGGAGLGVGNSVATATGVSFSNTATLLGTTVTVNYNCQP